MREPDTWKAHPPKDPRPRQPAEGSLPDVPDRCPHPRFREEMFSEMGRPLWPFSSFLWCYVTLPGLLALLIICFMQLFQGTHLYYTAWNASGVRLPHPGLPLPP